MYVCVDVCEASSLSRVWANDPSSSRRASLSTGWCLCLAVVHNLYRRSGKSVGGGIARRPRHEADRLSFFFRASRRGVLAALLGMRGFLICSGLALGASFSWRTPPVRTVLVGRVAPVRAAADGADGEGGQEWFLDLDIREAEFDDEPVVDVAADVTTIDSAEPDEDGWVEPVGEEDEEGVVNVREFLPMLMQVKYGDDWELLLDDEDEYEEDGEDEEGLIDAEIDDEAEGASGKYVAEYNYEPVEEDEQEEAALRAKMKEVLEEEGEEDEEEAELGSDELDLDALTLPADPREMSRTLATFIEQLETGQEELPKPFPESEWAMIFGCAFTNERFNELVNTWANLRVLLHVNFPDIEVAAARPQSYARDPLTDCTAALLPKYHAANTRQHALKPARHPTTAADPGGRSRGAGRRGARPPEGPRHPPGDGAARDRRGDLRLRRLLRQAARI